MEQDQYIQNTEGKWREGPIEHWFKAVEDLIASLEHPNGDPENTHDLEDRLLWEFVSHVYQRTDDPCIDGMYKALLELRNMERIRWYA